MILKLHNLDEDVPILLSAAYGARVLDVEFVDMHYVREIMLTGSAERVAQTLTCRGSLSSAIEQICCRCLKQIAKEVCMTFDFSYEIAGQETIDMTNDVRDVLILNHPEQFLCDENCHGICAICGKNLNLEKCTCHEPASPPSQQWTLLKKFLKRGGY